MQNVFVVLIMLEPMDPDQLVPFSSGGTEEARRVSRYSRPDLETARLGSL